ncbi:MAG: cytochrome c biogenesis CcdA family protein [Actinomycetota bacterium]
MTDPSIPIAFAAGLVSFLSPCVLPLVPGYISYMSGIGSIDATDRTGSMRAGAAALAFVAGFTAIFVALGASATLLGSVLRDYQEELSQVGGVLIIALGLLFIGVIKVPWLYRERRFHPTPGAGLWGSAVLGAAFAFGWSPCIGATLGAVLTMSAGGSVAGGPAKGALLLAVYSLGLGVPFILAGLGVTRLTGAVRWLRRHTRAINLASGALLVGVGLLFVTGQFFQMSVWFQRTFPEVPFDL